MSQPMNGYGAEPSGVGCMAPPGQRLNRPCWKSSSRLIGGIAVSVFVAWSKLEGLNTGETRA